MTGNADLDADVCVIGAGPAGSTLAARLCTMGHRVILVERAAFPRPHLGESLSVGVSTLLEASGAWNAVNAAGFPRIHAVDVRWESGPRTRVDPDGQGVLVDRGRFDQLLLQHAIELGARALQPATVRRQVHRCGRGWDVLVDDQHRTRTVRAAVVADATGRRARSRAALRTGCETLALYAYWRGVGLPTRPRIEAGNVAWFWGVPLPDGSYNTLAFVDRARFVAEPGPLRQRFLSLLAQTAVLGNDASVIDATCGRIRMMDATAYFDSACVTRDSIKVGDAALAIDPLSSSGVQKAIQSALAAAVVVNTLLRRPESGEIAQQFYVESLRSASTQHARWAAGHYALAGAGRADPFWHDRADPAGLTADEGIGPRMDHAPTADLRIAISADAAFVRVPVIDGDYVTMRAAVRHRDLPDPIAFVGGCEIAPLLQRVNDGMTLLDLAREWAPEVPLAAGLRVAGWLFRHGLVVERGTAA